MADPWTFLDFAFGNDSLSRTLFTGHAKCN